MPKENQNKKETSGCGCANIPISLILIFFGASYWLFSQRGNLNLARFIPKDLPVDIPVLNLPSNQKSSESNSVLNSTPTSDSNLPESKSNNSHNSNDASKTSTSSLPNSPVSETVNPTNSLKPETQTLPDPKTSPTPTVSPTQKKQRQIRGIYLSRYQITNNATEKVIRERVRYYHSQGINTIIHGVWGNACTMYKSEVMEKYFGAKSCPNLFRDRWLDWLIDEAHKNGMEVHAYFEKGIKIDKDSPIFDLAIERKWVVPGVDRTYKDVEHYILDVEIPEVADFFRDILVEFVQKYPTIDAVQWDDYLGYHAELPGKVDRTNKLTNFVQGMITAMKKANPKVSFDICHHNPYWAKRYFAADWEKWDVDRAFIQVYNDQNFSAELNYVEKYNGIAISDQQLHRLPEIITNKKIESVLLFPVSDSGEELATKFKKISLQENK